MEIFEGQDLLKFSEQFVDDDSCKKYLSDIKWESGYNCVKCGHSACQIRANYSRTCNICSHTESPTANTLFHKVKFGIRKAFFICFEMATSTQSLSASYMSKRYSIRASTARLFMHKVREAMKSSERFPMTGQVQVDEFVIGGKERGKVGRSYSSKKKKVVCAVELTEKEQVKRIYAMQIDNYSSKELCKIFERHICPKAMITTDEWKGYRPIAKDYNIEQRPSKKGENFPILHIMIHKIKTWIRTTYSWVSHHHINRYLDEFSFRINRSQNKKSIFDKLIRRMVKADNIYHNQIVCT